MGRQFHKIYSNKETKDWVTQGCRSAGIGCVECKGPVIEAVQKELEPIRERALPYEENPTAIKAILNEGRERARDAARETIDDVREVMGLE